MAVYTCIMYVATCDGCGKEMPGSPFNHINAPREAIMNNPDCMIKDGKGYCPECTAKIRNEEK